LTVFFILTTVFCFGQKMLNEVKLRNTQGEDLIQITSLLNKGIIENWDKSVGGYIETFVPKGDDSYTEYINLKESKAVIFFTKNYKSGNANYILYQNTRQNVTFFITYISNSPDSVKINNMHNIIKEMRFE